jgi:hypothetical protein
MALRSEAREAGREGAGEMELEKEEEEEEEKEESSLGFNY